MSLLCCMSPQLAMMRNRPPPRGRLSLPSGSNPRGGLGMGILVLSSPLAFPWGDSGGSPYILHMSSSSLPGPFSCLATRWSLPSFSVLMWCPGGLCVGVGECLLSGVLVLPLCSSTLLCLVLSIGSSSRPYSFCIVLPMVGCS